MTDDCIVQFGTSRFLQAHVDLFAQQSQEAGRVVAPIVVVQTTADAARAPRLKGFNDPAGFPVRVRGLDADGERIELALTVRSVARALSAAQDWPELKRTFVERARFVISNSGDAGFEPAPQDRSPHILEGETAPRSFPAMLLALLHLRWRAGGTGVTMLPCELVQRNGDRLRAVLLDLADVSSAPAVFRTWLATQCVWANTLVDRIVSEPIEPVGAVTEPYALWAIERRPGLELPFSHPAVVLTEDLAVYERLKLHILNLGHTWLAESWREMGAPAAMNVRELLAHERAGPDLDRLFAAEVLPGFAAKGLGDQAKTYVDQTMMRFRNPFLDHRLADIFQNHGLKVLKRIGGFVDWVDTAGAGLELTRLRGLAARYALS
jgi:tagaturonate reductase